MCALCTRESQQLHVARVIKQNTSGQGPSQSLHVGVVKVQKARLIGPLLFASEVLVLLGASCLPLQHAVQGTGQTLKWKIIIVSVIN